ncbi:MAG: RibD family protein, partial [Candidatus Sumerlaeia bacterium]|nr:RibD family protein [Candidatus Sumerlaeia bacterium]
TDRGESQWITNALSREYAHQLRSQVDAIVVGAQTVIQDNPLLTVRLKNYKGKQPRRVILDYGLKVPSTARCLTDRRGGERWVITHQSASRTKIRCLEKMGVRVICLPGRSGKIDIKKLMELFFREQILSVLVEGGRHLAGSFMRAGVVDKIVAFIAPKLIGGTKLTTPIVDWAVHSIKEAVELAEVQIKIFGTDVGVEGYLTGVD